MHWAIRMGDATTGVTIFWVDKGIDTGPVLLQRRSTIGPGRHRRLAVLRPAVPAGRRGAGGGGAAWCARATRRASCRTKRSATYEPPADDGNSAIDWSKPAREVYNLIRGSNPQPGAHARLRGELVRIFDARMSDGAPAESPGTVLATGDTIDVALAGGVLHVQRLQPTGARKIPAAEFASSATISAGDRFEDGAPGA